MTRVAKLWLVLGLPLVPAWVGALWWMNRPAPLPSEAEQDALYTEAIRFMVRSERGDFRVWDAPVRDGELDEDQLRMVAMEVGAERGLPAPDPLVHALPGIFGRNRLGYAHPFGAGVAPEIRRAEGAATAGTATLELSRIAFDSTRDRAALVVGLSRYWGPTVMGFSKGVRLLFHRTASGGWVVDDEAQVWIT